jgi:hypothetical protein
MLLWEIRTVVPEIPATINQLAWGKAKGFLGLRPGSNPEGAQLSRGRAHRSSGNDSPARPVSIPTPFGASITDLNRVQFETRS